MNKFVSAYGPTILVFSCFFIFLLILNVSPSEPKFSHEDHVIITTGFYQGTEGYVEECYSGRHNVYTVRIRFMRQGVAYQKVVEIREASLRSVVTTETSGEKHE